MATTIAELDYKIIAQTEQFDRAVTVTAAETRQLNKAIRESRTPIERYEHELDNLNNLRRKGVLTAEQYAKAVAKERRAYEQATTAARRHQGVLRSLGSTAMKYRSALLAGVAGVGIVAGIRKVSSAIGDQMDELDNLAKTADKLGVEVENLQTFRFAAGQMSGMDVREFDTAMQRIVRRIAEAAKGFGEAKKSLERLNLDAKELAQMRPEDAFLKIATAMQGIPTQAERLQLTVGLADIEGAKLVNTFNAGAGEIERMRDELEKTGQLMDREMLAGVEAANDASDTLAKSWDSIGKTLTVVIAPTIETIANDMRSMTGDLNTALTDLKRNARTIETIYGGARDLFTGETAGAGGIFGYRNRKTGDLLARALSDATGGNIDPAQVLAQVKAQREMEAAAEKQRKAAEAIEGAEKERKGIEARREEDAKRLQERRKRALERERDQVKDQIDLIKKEARQADKAGKIQQNLADVANSFGAGTRGEYQFLVNRQKEQRQREQALAEQRRQNELTNQTNGKLDTANAQLAAIEQKLEATKRI